MSLREAAQVAALAADISDAAANAAGGNELDETESAVAEERAATKDALLAFGNTLREHLAAIETALAEAMAATHVEVPLVEQNEPVIAPEAEKPADGTPPGFTPQ